MRLVKEVCKVCKVEKCGGLWTGFDEWHWEEHKKVRCPQQALKRCESGDDSPLNASVNQDPPSWCICKNRQLKVREQIDKYAPNRQSDSPRLASGARLRSEFRK